MHKDYPRDIDNRVSCPTLEQVLRNQPFIEVSDAFSWGAFIFNTNIRRLFHVLDGKPEVFHTAHCSNPSRIPDTLSRIIDAGGENGYDERHCFMRLMRGLQHIEESHVPYDDNTRAFVRAAYGEIALLIREWPCRELFEYESALKDFLSHIFHKFHPVTPPDVYTKKIIEKALYVAHCRHSLYLKYQEQEAQPPTPAELAIREIQKLRHEQHALNTRIHDKIDTATKDVKQTIGGKINYARASIISAIHGDDEENAIKEAMAQRAESEMNHHPRMAPRTAWKRIFDEYEGIPGAHKTFDAFRKQMERRLSKKK